MYILYKGSMAQFLSLMILSSLYLLAGCNSVIEPDTADRFFFHTDGAELAVQVDGNVNSQVFILFLHGGPGGSGYEYNSGSYSESLEERYAMVYLDQRGQGASQGRYDPGAITLQTFSDDIYNLSRFLKKKYGEDISLFLAGHSWGGTTGTHALIHTEVQALLNGWIELNGAHDIPLLNQAAVSMLHVYGTREVAAGNNTQEWQDILDFVGGVDSLNVSDQESGQLNSFGFDAEGYLLPANSDADEAGRGRWAFMGSPIAPLATLVGNSTADLVGAETEATSLTGRLGEVNIPSLFVAGKYDFVVPPRLAQTAFEAVGTEDKYLKIFENSGHSPMDTEAAALVQSMVDFIEAHK